ncbi:iron complex transport system ATP-binding protein [Streptosporangium becharense]|uniref:Iron complex transport system ATP-binding protein n=1 Tax=Streptosporangium becharense TaxID=1816182 RepID=A0A7W9MFJ3_9ACTN|nr:ABC transporter ATP-binding protein [Streptosporangium becharense]MBB2911999.1 iron complex transport system ATP-binding protein [Streptosporangium becharense]MBB5818546.1 iron complex transport system ATP-binding protein [Streptosporangium becharense]
MSAGEQEETVAGEQGEATAETAEDTAVTAGRRGDGPVADGTPTDGRRAGGLRVTGLSVVLDRRTVLSDVGFDVRAGGWLAVVGANGAGKSTLLRAVAGVLPHAGEVLVDGAQVRRLSPRRRARLIAYAPQSPALPADMTVFDYALLGRTPYIPYFSREDRRDREVTASVLERLDLTELAARRLGHLSGGERQRVVLARALAQQAPVLLLDEPTTALDLGHQQQVMELVDRLRLADGLTVVTTLHDLSLAGQYADAMVLVSGGRIAAAGAPAEVLTGELIGEHFDARVRVSTGPGGRPEVHLERP